MRKQLREFGAKPPFSFKGEEIEGRSSGDMLLTTRDQLSCLGVSFSSWLVYSIIKVAFV